MHVKYDAHDGDGDDDDDYDDDDDDDDESLSHWHWTNFITAIMMIFIYECEDYNVKIIIM